MPCELTLWVRNFITRIAPLWDRLLTNASFRARSGFLLGYHISKFWEYEVGETTRCRFSAFYVSAFYIHGVTAKTVRFEQKSGISVQ